MKKFDRWAPTVIRLTLGVIFIKHGWLKFQSLLKWVATGQSWSLVETVSFMPFLSPLFWAVVVTLAELVGGLAVFVGYWTRLGASLIATVMAFAIVAVHLPQGDAVEFQAALLSMAVSLILTGPGRYSIKLIK
ncbi:MAG: DoxX family protein [bacterium]